MVEIILNQRRLALIFIISFISILILGIPYLQQDTILYTIILNASSARSDEQNLHSEGENDKTAQEIIQNSRKGSINAEFPGELYGLTLKEIEELAKNKQADDLQKKARKALKLLKDGRFKKQII